MKEHIDEIHALLDTFSDVYGKGAQTVTVYVHPTRERTVLVDMSGRVWADKQVLCTHGVKDGRRRTYLF